MSTFNGFVNLANDNLQNTNEIIKKMTSKLTRIGVTEESFFFEKYINIGYKKDINDNNQITHFSLGDSNYTIIFSGVIYNIKEIQKQISNFSFNFENVPTPEIVLKAYISLGSDVFKIFNGAFSFIIWNNHSKELLLVRDHFGLKPLFYTFADGTLIFSSEIKSLLEYPDIEVAIDERSICELFGLGPAKTPGLTAFKNIFEVKPANFIVFNENGLFITEYWALKSLPHTNSFAQTCSEVKYLLENSINQQISDTFSVSTMLSGGLDSSILTAYISSLYKKKNLEPLKTFSVDYIDNDKNFIKNSFQPDSDKYYIDIMKNKYSTNHTTIVFDTSDLIDTLKDAMIARDYPGMADVDSSLLLFCKKIRKESPIAISGECSDEIFSGYPWFFKSEALESNTFPWSLAIAERQSLLNSELSNKINLKDYISEKYTSSLEKVAVLDTDSLETAKKRKISYLTLNWFMQTLIVRAEAMSKIAGLELRVPFCDYRLVQYLWNIPWEIKALNGREKGLLRYIMKDFLPSEIVDRKKSPYPKTHNPTYLKAIKQLLLDIINNTNSPINQIIDKNYVLNIINTNGENFQYPWYGQLMTGPQLMAYLVQLNMWLEEYNPKFLL